MWVCQTCKQEIEDSFDTCWKCYEGSDTEKEDLERAKKETEQLKKIEEEKKEQEKPLIKKWKRARLFLIIASIPLWIVEVLARQISLELGFKIYGNSAIFILINFFITGGIVRYKLLNSEKKINSTILYSFKIFFLVYFARIIFGLLIGLIF